MPNQEEPSLRCIDARTRAKELAAAPMTIQLAGEAVWGESMFINAQKAANIRCLAQYRLCRNPDAM